MKNTSDRGRGTPPPKDGEPASIILAISYHGSFVDGNFSTAIGPQNDRPLFSMIDASLMAQERIRAE